VHCDCFLTLAKDFKVGVIFFFFVSLGPLIYSKGDLTPNGGASPSTKHSPSPHNKEAKVIWALSNV